MGIVGNSQVAVFSTPTMAEGILSRGPEYFLRDDRQGSAIGSAARFLQEGTWPAASKTVTQGAKCDQQGSQKYGLQWLSDPRSISEL